MFPTLASQRQEASELLSSNSPSNIARPNTPMILIPNLITREQERESSGKCSYIIFFGIMSYILNALTHDIFPLAPCLKQISTSSWTIHG